MRRLGTFAAVAREREVSRASVSQRVKRALERAEKRREMGLA
jgi:DNA-binding transcriptional LysR family regulator